MTKILIFGGIALVAVLAYGGVRLARAINEALDDPYFDERNWH